MHTTFINKTVLLIFIIIGLNTIICQEHIHWGTTNDPHNGLTITWQSPGISDQIKWGYTQSYEQGTYNGARRNDYSNYLYDYTFPAINPNTTIYYSINANNVWSSAKSFLTAVSKSTNNFSFIAGGDSRTNIDDWQTAANVIAAQSVEFHLFLGDHVNTGSSSTDWNNWYSKGDNFIENNLVFHTAGNHEYGSIYLNQFVLPANEKWYSFEFGDALFVCLFSQSEFSTQHSWLINVLANSNKKWIIVFFHKPFFTVGNHANEMDSYLNTWWKAFDDYGVDVVLNGHSHFYLRSKPINRNVSSTSAAAEYGSESDQGRLQVIAGAYGAPLTATGTDWFVEQNLSTMNYTKFDVTTNKLTMRAYNMQNSLIDEVVINKSSGGTIPDITPPQVPDNFRLEIVQGAVILRWDANTEPDLIGYDLFKGTIDGGWKDYLAGVGNSTTSYTDTDLESNTAYYYKISARDNSGNSSARSVQISAVTLNIENTFVAYPFELDQNSPNPFNSRTNINYSINTESQVTLIIYDLVGKVITTLVNEEQQPGIYYTAWDGTDANGNDIVSGVYLLQLKTEEAVVNRKMILLR